MSKLLTKGGQGKINVGGTCHGGAAHKVYVKGNKGFEKVGELDASGKVMNKHMSDTGNFINSKDIIWIKR